MSYTEYANVIEKGNVPPKHYGRSLILISVVFGKPVRFVRAATSGLKVRLACFVDI